MGRGNQDKRRFQAAHSGKGFLDASDIVRSQKRERTTRDQRPPTLPKVDVHGILFAVVAICAEHAVTPDMSWGTLPAVLQKKWTAYDCDHLVQDAIQREDEEARARTVRRGWDRTAGSRYEFAADGVTFESSGGI